LTKLEFVGLDELSGIMVTKGREKAYQNIREMKDKIDGILAFGGYLDHELTSLGLPVLIVRSLFGIGNWKKGMSTIYI